MLCQALHPKYFPHGSSVLSGSAFTVGSILRTSYIATSFPDRTPTVGRLGGLRSEPRTSLVKRIGIITACWEEAILGEFFSFSEVDSNIATSWGEIPFRAYGMSPERASVKSDCTSCKGHLSSLR